MKIKQQFGKNGFIYRIIMTGTRALVYEQWDKSKLAGYEVHRLRPRLIRYPDPSGWFTNRLPKNEDFGKWAWSYYPNAWGRAIAHYFEIEGCAAQRSLEQNTILVDDPRLLV